MPPTVTNRVAEIRRGMGIPDFIDMRGRAPATAPGELDQAMRDRERMLAYKIRASGLDELEEDAEAVRLRGEIEKTELELKRLELLQKKRELMGGDGTGDKESILQNVIGLLAGEKAQVVQNNADL